MCLSPHLNLSSYVYNSLGMCLSIETSRYLSLSINLYVSVSVYTPICFMRLKISISVHSHAYIYLCQYTYRCLSLSVHLQVSASIHKPAGVCLYQYTFRCVSPCLHLQVSVRLYICRYLSPSAQFAVQSLSSLANHTGKLYWLLDFTVEIKTKLLQ